MVQGWLRAGMPPDAMTLYNPREKPVPAGMRLCLRLPHQITGDVVLACKPQVLDDVAPELDARLSGDATVLSVLAGVTAERLAQALPRAGGHVRLMPNLAAAINKSASLLYADSLNDERHDCASRLALMLGAAEWLEEEDLFDLATALAGSGPAFTFRFAQVLTEAAVELGMEGGQAERLTLAMMDGAASLACQANETPAALAARVASKGGMTQRGLDELDRNGALQQLVLRTLTAARDRGRELGSGTAGRSRA